jgi:hypothetical protein
MRVRWTSHLKAARDGSQLVFARAIRKYGPSAFTHEVLEEADTLDAANEAEQWWIAHFGSDDRALGYNVEPGGGAKVTHPDTRQKMRDRHAARSPEEKEALRQALRDGHAKMTPEAREARREKSRAARARVLAHSTPELLRQQAAAAKAANRLAFDAMTDEQKHDCGVRLGKASAEARRKIYGDGAGPRDAKGRYRRRSD